jgi:hypothetical protein
MLGATNCSKYNKHEQWPSRRISLGTVHQLRSQTPTVLAASLSTPATEASIRRYIQSIQRLQRELLQSKVVALLDSTYFSDPSKVVRHQKARKSKGRRCWIHLFQGMQVSNWGFVHNMQKFFMMRNLPGGAPSPKQLHCLLHLLSQPMAALDAHPKDESSHGLEGTPSFSSPCFKTKMGEDAYAFSALALVEC